MFTREKRALTPAHSPELYIYNNINEDIDRIDVLYAYFDIYIYQDNRANFLKIWNISFRNKILKIRIFIYRGFLCN